VHLKEFSYDQQRRRFDVVIGTAGLDLNALMKKLDAMNYNGYLSIEYEGEPDNPLPNLEKCVAAARAAIDFCTSNPGRS